MKLLTINTHSLIEEQYEKKLHQFAEMVLLEEPDIIAMQEVNQSINESVLADFLLPGYVTCKKMDVMIRQDNHAARLACVLREHGCFFYWTWLPLKIGYGKYDEGLAIFSRRPIVETEQFLISSCNDYGNWKTRKILGAKVEGLDDWFYTVHMGWWDDAEEPFLRQWETFQGFLKEKQKGSDQIWMLGDFNSPAGVCGEGYDCVSGYGWKDTYQLAKEKDDGITVGKVIDGWRDSFSEADKGMRIDFVWCLKEVPVCSSMVVCNGEHYPVVSDHYGVMVVTEEQEGAEE